MGRVDPSVPAFTFRQSGAELQRILDTVQRLDAAKINAMLDLLNEIRNISHGDDNESIGQQLINALDSMVKETEVQTELNDSTYPPQTKVIKDAINTHKTATELDHPDGSVKERHIASGAVGSNAIKDSAVRSNHIAANAITQDKITDKAVNKAKLSAALQNIIDSAVSDTDFMNKISTISKAPKYCLSALLRDTGTGYNIPEYALNEYIIIKNDTTQDFNEYNPIPYSEVSGWKITNKTMYSDKAYLCVLRDSRGNGNDTVTYGTIEVVMELGSDIVNIGGVWHGGVELTHTENAVPKNISGAKARDFYLNTESFGVYFTHDGKLWNYIGNLNGSIDTSKFALINSPNFTGTPTADTPSTTNNSRQLATTEFVRNAIDKYASSGSGGVEQDFTGTITFDHIPLFMSALPEIISQDISITNDDDPTKVGVQVEGSVRWDNRVYTATASTTFDATANHGSLDESFTYLYIKCNRQDPTQSTVVFEYDKSRPVTDEYIIIPIARVDAKYSMYPTEGWYIRSYDNYITYGDVATDTFVLQSQLDKVTKELKELEQKVEKYLSC